LRLESLEGLFAEAPRESGHAMAANVQRLVPIIRPSDEHERQADLYHLHRLDGLRHAGDPHRFDLPKLHVLNTEKGHELADDMQQRDIIAGTYVFRCQGLT